MKSILILTLVMLIHMSNCNSQNNEIKLTILDSANTTSQDGKIRLHVQLSNNSNTSYILFNFSAVSYPYASEAKHHTKHITAGLVFFLKDSANKYVNMSVPIPWPKNDHPTIMECNENREITGIQDE